MAKLVLISGGARSGKSRFAQDLARRIGGNDVLFVATSEARDEEMKRRIDLHRKDRPAQWGLMEVPLGVGTALGTAGDHSPVVLIDCLTLLVSNLLLANEGCDEATIEGRMREELSSLVETIERRSGTVLIVSGEVGQGLVPSSRLGRSFRDLLGRANQDIAARADAVYFMVAGYAVETKSLAVSIEQAAERLADDSP